MTGYWLVFVDLAGCRTRTIHQIHSRHGPTVRVGPHEVSFSNQEIIKELYSYQTSFMKAPVYDDVSMRPVGIFSMRDNKERNQRRRLLSHAFSQSNLLDTEPLMKEHVNELFAFIKPKLGQSVDTLTTFRRLSFDIVGELFLGQSFNGLKSPETPRFLIDLDSHFILAEIKMNFPLIYHILDLLPIAAVQHFFASTERNRQYGKDAFENYIAQYGRNSGRRDLLTKVVVAKDDEGAPLTDLEIYTEVAHLVHAGSDTTSTTLTHLFWLLAKDPEWPSRLRAELMTVPSRTDRVFTYKEVIGLPVLEPVINEALRLYPAAPASLPRETPSGGRTLNGIFILEKLTVVSMQCYTTHRHPDVFPHPEKFLPDRWLGEKAVTPEMRTMFMPFSAGSRACLGINLAWMEQKVITTSLLEAYKVQLAPSTTDESMLFLGHFLALPKSGTCDLIFTKVEPTEPTTNSGLGTQVK
ncbi:uncharacterized protein Z519_03892 [Cladophialophora bantiana CBS 173.52]|uniref:Cytochrome P450 n=1 Tax=Cladophialophora bantiana (strain ATCC 10958 / CBS 173.52 / CDC B-1940 / NIH 8579) TaxID=1442370 RepID=A0A0D2HPI1_CLAB1|nr:uncharacterized protein Z519_03892 [Cladophialophora bantiana CBS 173.52]KIW95308.1 hypothetical protein Z519_03892 [Cladophialophora bantiana CBS 173.52]